MKAVLRLGGARVLGGVLVLLAATLFSGCASVPMASAEADAAAKRFEAPAGKATIYVYRNEIIGGAVALTVALDGRVVLVISNNSASGAMQRAARHAVSGMHLSGRTHPGAGENSRTTTLWELTASIPGGSTASTAAITESRSPAGSIVISIAST